MNSHQLRIGLAANRRLGCRALHSLVDADLVPAVLLVAAGRSADIWTDKTIDVFRKAAGDAAVIRGTTFRAADGVKFLRALQLDYLISIHFPYIVPREVLQLPRIGTLNLHPAYLPYNRGWHTPSWAIADGTPYGATLHWMDQGVDTGDIALQQQVTVLPGDTADGLYQRVLDAEHELFELALPMIVANRLPRIPQTSAGTEHRKADLEQQQRLDLTAQEPVGNTLRRLRALTTNSWQEAAFYEADGMRYRVRVEIRSEPAVESDRKKAA